MSRTGAVLLKALALGVAVSFLAGAVLTAAPPLVSGAAPRDGGVDRRSINATKSGPLPEPEPVAADAAVPEPAFFPATKSAVMPRPRPKPADAGSTSSVFGEPTYFPASKSFGGNDLRGNTGGLGTGKAPRPQQAPTQQAPTQAP